MERLKKMNMASVMVILSVLLYKGAMVEAMNGLQVLIEDPFHSIAAGLISTAILVIVFLLCQCYDRMAS